MRSSKSRSRSKNNRNRNTLGNVVNRVFDSSGPEGKVRGTPQQIIDKYNQLARDAALSNDRVATENFQQHAEHYMRLLSEAQKEADQRREQQERENRERQAQRDRDRSDRDQTRGDTRGEGGHQGGSHQPDVGFEQQPQPRQPEPEKASVPGLGDQPDLMGAGSDDEEDSGLVETPESRAESKPKPRARRSKKTEGGEAPAAAAAEPGAEAQPAEKPKRPRKPRKKPEQPSSDGGSAPDAAE
ncbi:MULTISPECIES: DUF4167 domain-containing protein [unclassified Salipiger]|uniref:DUF4167 domain-containing protein n=1 Tax=unclassified Salipiger TaxID=2640570 RepID=UPI0013BC97AF|nr:MULTISPECIES: DUF4167 domain-containing protein [unclassified Salipiger]NDV50996.1 DUF4167 domain-containing protein [Salipiger sp. PrR003]NDW33948.1 DUF4167 domain-containing protein [Salipiger sp. PrR007]